MEEILVYPSIYRVFFCIQGPRWFSRISSINSTTCWTKRDILSKPDPTSHRSQQYHPPDTQCMVYIPMLTYLTYIKFTHSCIHVGKRTIHWKYAGNNNNNNNNNFPNQNCQNLRQLMQGSWIILHVSLCFLPWWRFAKFWCPSFTNRSSSSWAKQLTEENTKIHRHSPEEKKFPENWWLEDAFFPLWNVFLGDKFVCFSGV